MSFYRPFFATALTALLLLACCWGPPAGQAQRNYSRIVGTSDSVLWLYVWVDKNGGTIAGARSEETSDENAPAGNALPLAPFERALGGTITPMAPGERISGPQRWSVLGHCDGMFHLSGGLRQGKIDPQPLLPLLRSQRVRWLSITVLLSPQPDSRCTGAARFSSRFSGSQTHSIYYSRMIDTDKPAELRRPIVLAYGYGPGNAAKIVLPLLLVLLASFALTLWMRTKALQAETRASAAGRAIDPAVVWFGYGRYLQALSSGIWLVWFPLVIALHAIGFLSFLVGTSWLTHSGLPLLLIYLPALAIIGCYGLSYPVFSRLRGLEYTRGEMLRQAAWGQSRLLPLICALNGATEFVYDPKVTVAWLAGAFLLAQITRQGAARALGALPQALTVGELRDRIFVLAAGAGVPVRQVYLLRAGKGRLANAFASLGSTLLLTDYLLLRLTKREVDAVVGHELTHLKKRHPQTLQIAYLSLFGAAVGVTIILETQASLSALAGAAYAVVTVAGLLIVYGLSRRFEWAADAGAVSLTGDGEALITGLAKISALNQTPLTWGRWQERWLTHPPTLLRMQRIGLAVGLSPERVQMLARPAAESEAEDAPEEHYHVPAQEADTLVFSGRRKAQLQQAMSWSFLLLTPLIAAAAARTGLWPAALIGLILALLAPRLVVEALQQRWYARLGVLLRKKMEAEGTLKPGEPAEFVAYSPSPFPRLYEGFYDWDLGFLQTAGSRLCFTGEKTRFALDAAQIISVEQREDTPGFGKRWSRLYLRWSDGVPDSPTPHYSFSLRCGLSGSVWRSGSATDGTRQRLEEWRVASSSLVFRGPPETSAERLPFRDEVTALSPRQAFTLRGVTQALLVQLGFAAGISVLFGLSFPLSAASGEWSKNIGGWYVLLASLLAVLSAFLPLRLYRDRSA